MTTADDDPEIQRARARLERARKRYEQKRAAKRKRERRRDTRSKVLLGAWMRDVELPKIRDDGEHGMIEAIAGSVGEMIARQTHKSVESRQGDIDDLRPVFGDDWADRWKKQLEADGG